MKITIITVAYNAANTVADTLDSVASQTYGDIEHILVDGASTDATLNVVKDHDTQPDQLISEPDQGIYDAMNKGISRASGDVIGFLNADDVYWDETVIARVVEAMHTDGLDALFGDVLFFGDDKLKKPKRRYRSNHFNPDRISWGWMPAHPTLFLRQSVYERVGLFKIDYTIAGDYEFVARAFRRGKLRYRYLPEVLVKMRIGGISTRSWRNSFVLNKEVLRACRENDIDTNILKILSKYPRKILGLFC